MPQLDHIAVNTRLLLAGQLEGIGRYAHEVLQRLVQQHPDTRFTFFFDRPYSPEFVYGPNVQALHVPPQARHPLLWHGWFHTALPLMLRRLRPDVFFSPEFYLTASRRVPQVPVFHDLAYEHFPDHIAGWAGRYCRRWSPRYAHRAAHILTVSEFTRQDLVTQYGIDEASITVAYNGASRAFGPVSDAIKRDTHQQYTGGKPYFLYVGAIHPRKNIVRLLQAFDAFKRDTGADTRLVLAGRKAWQFTEALHTYEAMDHREDVIMTGYIPDEALVRLYSSALALTYVPLFEGFGLPILEAMHAEVPVICANTTSMPEVAGEAALLVNPHEVAEIAGAMRAIWSEGSLRTTLVSAGREQRKKFDWDHTAQKVWETLERASRKPASPKG